MLRTVLSLAVSGMLIGAASADEASKRAKVLELTRALGLQDSFESARKTVEE